MIGARRVIVATTGCVAEGEVSVVYKLKFASSFCAFWGVGGDAVGVGFERCSGSLVSWCLKERGGKVKERRSYLL